jgi:hypothetical protein
MNAKENTKKEESSFQTDTLTDLAVSDEHADRATGGSTHDPQGRLLIGTDGGIWRG